MTYIKTIEVKDFFGKGNFHWNLNKSVNIIGGRNGGGKSTLFKACYYLLSDPQGPQKVDALMDSIAQSLSITMTDDTVISWTRNENHWHFVDSLPIVFSSPIVKVEKSDGEEISLLEFQQKVTANLIASFEQHLSKAIQYEKQPQSVFLEDPSMLDLLIKDQIELRNADFSLFMEKYADDSIENNKARTEYMTQYKQLYTVLMTFLSDYDDQPKSKFEFTKAGNTFGYDRLSMGEKQILLLLLMVGNTRGEECVFFMDEPDLSMHIDWKEKLVTSLNMLNPQMQIILSTHAPSVITGWIDCVSDMSELFES